MTQGTLKINTEKLLPIIKQWLYSDKEIFLRELVSNACDALSKIKLLSERGEVDLQESDLRIDITLDKKKKTLTIDDTGIGMTSEEVEKYIAQLAFSGAEEFLEKYDEKEQVIGHFGLGFYSAYMVSSNVEIETLSYQKAAQAAYWSCDGTTNYTLNPGTKQSRGTEIILHIEDEEYLEEAKIRELLDKYCAFLPYPIHLNGTHINHEEPLWLKAPSECTEKEYLEFYRKLYPFEADPIFWVHLNVDYPFHLKGILYFPKIDPHFDFKKCPIQLYCHRVFVSNRCEDLIPDHLRVLRGAIDSPDIPLNVSRSYLQMDKTVRSLSGHISKKVADRLVSIHRTDPKSFTTHWQEIEMIVKLGALQEEKFYERVQDLLIWENLDGEWINTKDYLEKHKESYSDKVFYTQDPHSPFLSVYKEKEIEVVIAKSPLDAPLMSYLEGKHSPAKFQRIDGAIDNAILDPEKEKTLLGADGRTEGAKLADFVRSALGNPTFEVEAKSLASSSLPALIIIDEETRRIRDSFKLHRQSLPPQFADKKTFVLNTNSPLIDAIAKHADKELAKEMVEHLYQLAKLSQKELSSEELPKFVQKSSQILQKLLQG